MATLLFTDIEGSARLWEENADAMAQALSKHDELLTGCDGLGGAPLLEAAELLGIQDQALA